VADDRRRRCHGKICYSFREAHEQINLTKHRQHGMHSKKIPKRAYTCPVCGCWHLTSSTHYEED